MDEENQINDKLKIKRQLTNARVKKNRKKKCTESRQMNSSMPDDPTKETQNKQVKEYNSERKRQMTKERSRRFREKKRLNVLKSVYHVVHSFPFCRVILSTCCFIFLSVGLLKNNSFMLQTLAMNSYFQHI